MSSTIWSGWKNHIRAVNPVLQVGFGALEVNHRKNGLTEEFNTIGHWISFSIVVLQDHGNRVPQFRPALLPFSFG